MKIDVPKLFRLWNSNVTNEHICAELKITSSGLSRLSRVYGLQPRTHVKAHYNYRKADPSEQEIMELTAAIRQEWPAGEAEKRMVGQSRARVEVLRFVYTESTGVFT